MDTELQDWYKQIGQSPRKSNGNRELGNKIPLIRMYKLELIIIRRNNTENACTQKHEKAKYICFQWLWWAV